MTTTSRSTLPPWPLLLIPLALSSAVRGFWAPDEPRYAEVAREVFELKSFVVMHLCGDVYPDKPPMLFWLAGLLGRLSGWNAFTMRLVSLAATALSAWMTGVLARRWWGEREGRFAPALYLGFALVCQIGPRLQIDPLLSAFCLGGIVLASSRPSGASGDSVTLAALLWAGLSAGLGALTKGPVAWLHVGLPLVLWRLVPAAREGLPRPRSIGARGAAVGLAVLPVALWALSAVLIEESLFRDLFYGQHLERAVEGSRHGGPIWKNLERMPIQLLPWTPLVIAALFARRRQADPARVRIELWLSAMFVFFSVIPSKRDLYLLPVYPAAALLAARWLVTSTTLGDPEREAPKAERVAARFTYGFFLVLGVLFLGVGPWLAKSELDIDVEGLAWRGLPFAAASLATGVFVLRAWRARRDWLGPAVLGWAVSLSMIAGFVLPAIDRVKTAELAVADLLARPERPDEIPCIDVHPEAYRFYGHFEGHVPTVRAKVLPPREEREPGRFLALTRLKTWNKWSEEERAGLEIVARHEVGTRTILTLIAVP